MIDRAMWSQPGHEMPMRARLLQLARGLFEMGAATAVATVILSRDWPFSSLREGLGATVVTLLCAGALALGWQRWSAAWPRG